jgi:uncharacterized alkaline shock family protein YloU
VTAIGRARTAGEASATVGAMADLRAGGPIETVHSPAVAAHISHAVIATYAAAAAQDVAGVRGLVGGHFGGLERRTDPDRAAKGVRVSSDGDGVDVELHVVTDWGASIPAVATQLERQVRAYLASMLDLEPRSVSVLIEDIAPQP